MQNLFYLLIAIFCIIWILAIVKFFTRNADDPEQLSKPVGKPDWLSILRGEDEP